MRAVIGLLLISNFLSCKSSSSIGGDQHPQPIVEPEVRDEGSKPVVTPTLERSNDDEIWTKYSDAAKAEAIAKDKIAKDIKAAEEAEAKRVAEELARLEKLKETPHSEPEIDPPTAEVSLTVTYLSGRHIDGYPQDFSYKVKNFTFSKSVFSNRVRPSLSCELVQISTEVYSCDYVKTKSNCKRACETSDGTFGQIIQTCTECKTPELGVSIERFEGFN